MRTLYVSHKITDADPARQAKNLADAADWGRRLMALGFIAYGPWNVLEAPPVATPQEAWDYAMAQCYPLVEMCEGIFMCPGWDRSAGCKLELDFALDHGKATFWTVQRLMEWKESAA